MSVEAPEFEQAPQAAQRLLGGNLSDDASQKEVLLKQAKELLESDLPDLDAPKAWAIKAEVLGLQPLTEFVSMARQPLSARGGERPLHELGIPLVYGLDFAGATAKELPSTEDPAGLYNEMIEIVQHKPADREVVDRTRPVLERISKRAKKTKAQEVYAEVGTYTRHAGWVAARGANGDLLVAYERPETLGLLETAGYRENPGGYESGLYVPFNNNESTHKDKGIDWSKKQASTLEPLVSDR